MRDNWIIQDLLAWTSSFFSQKGIDNPRLEAEILLARVLNRDRVYLYANFDRPVDLRERDLFRDYIKRRVKGEPTAYIVGCKEFMSLNFKVTSDVLIPRPDTEILVESVLETVKPENTVKICDVGTGSGAIAISLAYYLPHAVVYATDISPAALEVARENAANNQVNINFLQGNLLEPIPDTEKFDIFTANLPYIAPDELELLDHEVKDFEPIIALVAPGDGLDLYRELIPPVWERLNKGGYVFFEISHNQGAGAYKLMQDFTDVVLLQDLAGRDRVIRARKG